MRITMFANNLQAMLQIARNSLLTPSTRLIQNKHDDFLRLAFNTASLSHSIPKSSPTNQNFALLLTDLYTNARGCFSQLRDQSRKQFSISIENLTFVGCRYLSLSPLPILIHFLSPYLPISRFSSTLVVHFPSFAPTRDNIPPTIPDILYPSHFTRHTTAQPTNTTIFAMFTSPALLSIVSPDEAVSKHVQVIAKLIQAQVVQHRPRLGRNVVSCSLSNRNVHTCHFISFREWYTHIIQTILLCDGKPKDAYKKLQQYFGTVFRDRSAQCTRSINLLLYLLFQIDNYYCDKSRLPQLSLWVQNKRVQELFKAFFYQCYNHLTNLQKNGHPRTNHTIKSRRDLVIVGGKICETTHGRLGMKWNEQIQKLKKGQSPTSLNLPVVPIEYIGTKYTTIIDENKKQPVSEDLLQELLYNGWFVLSSHAGTSPVYRLPISADFKNYPEQLDPNYYDPDNDNFDLKVSSRPGETPLGADAIADEDKGFIRSILKDLVIKEQDVARKEDSSQIDCNDSFMNTDLEEPMPPPCEEMSYVYCGYIVKQQPKSEKPSRSKDKDKEGSKNSSRSITSGLLGF